jgi:hypothetical protein
MTSALLSVLLVCNRRILRHRREIQQHVMFILIGPHVRHFSDGNQTVCPTLKNKSWLSIMAKRREPHRLDLLSAGNVLYGSSKMFFCQYVLLWC